MLKIIEIRKCLFKIQLKMSGVFFMRQCRLQCVHLVFTTWLVAGFLGKTFSLLIDQRVAVGLGCWAATRRTNKTTCDDRRCSSVANWTRSTSDLAVFVKPLPTSAIEDHSSSNSAVCYYCMPLGQVGGQALSVGPTQTAVTDCDKSLAERTICCCA